MGNSAFENNKPYVDKGSEALQWSDLDLVEHLASTDAEFKHHSVRTLPPAAREL